MDKSVTIAILARDMAFCLPEYLHCLDLLDYPKKLISLQVRTNDNRDETREVLEEWLSVVGSEYRKVSFDDSPITQDADPGHLWSQKNLSRIAMVRQQSLDRFAADPSDYYLVVDCDNFLTNPGTLKELIRCNEDIAAPMLEVLPHNSLYSNFFAAVNEWGYYQEVPGYNMIRNRLVQGTIVVPVVHCTYLAKAHAIVDKRVTYIDGTERYDFVIFTSSARKSGLRQVICNAQFWGYLLHGMADKREDEPRVYEELCKPRVLEALNGDVK